MEDLTWEQYIEALLVDYGCKFRMAHICALRKRDTGAADWYQILIKVVGPIIADYDKTGVHVKP